MCRNIKSVIKLSHKREIVCVCFALEGRRGGPHIHGHKESNTDLNLKTLTLRVQLNPQTHEY